MLNLKKSQTGFSLVELVIIIATLGVVSVVVMMRGTTPSAMTLPSQAQTLASDIRHTQTLAYTSGRRMRIALSQTGYSVSCVDGASPCPSASVLLQKGVTLTTSGIVTPLDFNSLGQPLTSAGASTAASYTLVSGSDTKTVAVAALTGLVTVP